MKKRIVALLLACLLLLGLCACQPARKDLKFYVVRGADVTDSMVNSTLLRVAKEKGRLAFTGEDIRGWYWKDHQVLLRDLAVKGGATDGGSALFQAKAEDLFLCVMGNEVLYVGGFSAAGDGVALLRDIYITDGEADNFAIACRTEYAAEKDPRNVEKLYNYLAQYDLLVGEGADAE